MCSSNIKNSLKIPRRVCIFSLFWSLFKTEEEGRKKKKEKTENEAPALTSQQFLKSQHTDMKFTGKL